MNEIPDSRGPRGEVRILDVEGRVRSDAAIPDLPDEELLEMYREMSLARHFDERAISLSRQGRLGTYTPLAGQEAAQIGAVHALEERDWLTPSFREHGAKIARGIDPRDILLYWGGHEAGNAAHADRNVFCEAIPVGSQIPHATGMAMAAKRRDERRVFLCFFGDGATSEGDFHEGLNFAGVFDTPTVFFCNNNGWAISVPTERQTASETLAQKAAAYGFDGILVDGMDPLASYTVTRAAVSRARDPPDGELRPTLIEALQYRFGPHTTSDDPSVYRDEAELERWKEHDGVRRMERFLREYGVLDDEREEAIQREIESTVAEAIEAAEAFEADPRSLFEHVYAEATPNIREQARVLEDLDGERDAHSGNDP